MTRAEDRQPTPPQRSHWVAACAHWCFCYSPTAHVAHRVVPDGPELRAQKCQTCERRERNQRAAAQADPISRHPEGA